MSDVEMKLEVETEDFTEELTDEALDREGAVRMCFPGSCGCGGRLGGN